MANGIRRRPFGDTGVELSMVGLGGIVVAHTEQEHADRVVAEAVERGVNYFDVAPTYANAQERLGPALEPYRKEVFLACKTNKRDLAGANAEFEESLRLLKTGYFDLYQLHGLIDVEEDVEAVFKNGVMDMLLERQKAGQIRFLGFSAHTEEAALLAMDRHDFTSVLFPVNFATFYKGKFGQAVLDKTQEKKVARLALKAMARQKWSDGHEDRETYSKCWYEPITDSELAELALRWTLSQPVTAALPPGEERLFRLAMDFAERYRPITPEEDELLRSRAQHLDPIFETSTV